MQSFWNSFVDLLIQALFLTKIKPGQYLKQTIIVLCPIQFVVSVASQLKQVVTCGKLFCDNPLFYNVADARQVFCFDVKHMGLAFQYFFIMIAVVIFVF